VAYDDGDPTRPPSIAPAPAKGVTDSPRKRRSRAGNLSAARNLVIVGGSYDRSASDFRQATSSAVSTRPQRGATGAETEIVNLDGGSSTAKPVRQRTPHSQRARWHLTARRYNVTRVRTVDRLSPPCPRPPAGLGGIWLREMNPAGCVVYARGRARLLCRLSQGNRPPSPVELGRGPEQSLPPAERHDLRSAAQAGSCRARSRPGARRADGPGCG